MAIVSNYFLICFAISITYTLVLCMHDGQKKTAMKITVVENMALRAVL